MISCPNWIAGCQCVIIAATTDKDLDREGRLAMMFCAVLSKKLASSYVFVAILAWPPSKGADRGGWRWRVSVRKFIPLSTLVGDLSRTRGKAERCTWTRKRDAPTYFSPTDRRSAHTHSPGSNRITSRRMHIHIHTLIHMHTHICVHRAECQCISEPARRVRDVG